MRQQLRELYPEARVAYLKSGGNFPYLAKSDEVAMHIKVRGARPESAGSGAQPRDGALTPARPRQPRRGAAPRAQVHFRPYSGAINSPFVVASSV